MHTVKLNLDTLIDAMEARPESNARTQAWYWLAELESVQFDGDALIVPSKEWDKTTYRTTPAHCTCPARGRCWHVEARLIINDALAEDARYDALADQDEYAAPVAVARAKPTKADKAKVYADVMELWV